MSLISKLFAWMKHPSQLADEYDRKYRLILVISIELMCFGVIFLITSLYLTIWFLSILVCIELIILSTCLMLLKRSNRFILCGYIINTSILLSITAINLWFGGTSSTFFGWFYVAPIMAAITLGLEGLILFGVLTIAIMFAFISGLWSALNPMSDAYLNHIVDILNHVFIFSVIITPLYNLLSANKKYESLLNEKNYLLYADKQKFHYLSHHDPLTNLPNRSYFHTHLRNMIEGMNTEQNTLSLFFMDLDGFKKINDQYGHEVGDLILLQASKRLQTSFREKDFIARLGGDEFTAVITYTKNDIIADVLAKRIEQEFKEPFLINNLTIRCTISLGRANYPLDSTEAETLLKIADQEMYRNKKMNYFKRTNTH